MEMGIRGRRALVNGGSAGMGRAAAEFLAAEGVDLVLAARRAERLEAAAQEIRSRYSVDVRTVAADHSTEEGRHRILEACPNPDILVATCSPPPMTPDHRVISMAQWQSSLDIGLLSPLQYMEAVLPGMQQRRWGRIVNIATIATKFPLELRILSGAPRAALVNYTVAVARRVAADNVTLNNVLPGMFHTAAVHDQFTDTARRNGTSYDIEVARFADAHQIPAKRFGDPRDVGSLVAWLCSEFAGYITGQSIVVDGATTRSTFQIDSRTSSGDALYRRTATHLLLPIALLSLINGTDRLNVIFAGQQLSRAIELSPTQLGPGVSTLFVAGLVFQFPHALLLRRAGIRLWLLLSMTVWGIAGSLMARLQGPHDLLAARTLLGMSSQDSALVLSPPINCLRHV